MEEEDEKNILILEEKVNNISIELLTSSSSSIILNDDILKIKKDYYKSLITALNIIRKQKQKIVDLQINLIEIENDCNKYNIMRFCCN